MKILCCGDQHWTTKSPKNRKDDYFQTVLDKLRQEVAIAKKESCQCMLFPGDLFDSFRENHLLVQEVMKILQQFTWPIIAVAGQHDQQFHNSDLKGTPLHTLETARLLMIAGSEPICLTNGVAVYGSSWKCEIPEITTPERLNILVLHKMIVDEKLWAQQEGHTWANHFLISSGYDLIVSGDNHHGFTTSKGKKHLINMGSMMRSTIAQIDHVPAVSMYDTDLRQFKVIPLNIKPIEDVMQLEKVEKEKERNEKLDAFVASLKGESLELSHKMKLDFRNALNDYIEENNIDADVSAILTDCMEGL